MMMRFLLSVVVFGLFCCEGFSNEEEIHKFTQCVPKTSLEVESFVNQTVHELSQAINNFSSYLECSPSFDSLRKEWDRVGNLFFTKSCLLYSLGLLFANPELEMAGKQGISKLHQCFVNFLNEGRLCESLLSYINERVGHEKFNPSQYYYLKAFLDAAGEDYEKLTKFKSFVNEKALPFTFLKGNAPASSENKSQFTLFSWNICGLPQPLSLIFGGVPPWQTRICGIIDTIKAQDADVICLQEVFDEEASLQLYNALKNKYCNFYVNIAPHNFGLNPISAGLSSGLFIASKYPIENCVWNRFNESVHPIIDRGFFSFQISQSDGKSAVVIATHMESSTDDPTLPSQAVECRLMQMKQILSAIEKNSLPERPVIVCGDLNIYWSMKEPAESLVRAHFFDSYNKDRTECSFETCTHCDFTGYWWPQYLMNTKRAVFKPIPYILDYVLVFANASKQTLIDPSAFITERIQTSDVKNPRAALSDHHALITRCKW